ncbi:hypothetical protein V8C44DRAFT_330133 [Trichoderma aethiopicum]
MLPLCISSWALSLIIKDAIDSSKTLQRTIQYFPSNERAVGDLLSDVKSLVQVLESLEKVAPDEGPVTSSLKLPLFCCHRNCQDLNAAIVNCLTSSAGASKNGLPDWTRVSFRGSSLRDVGVMMAAYKFSLAFILERLRTPNAPPTREAMDRFRQVTQDVTIIDLKAHLRELDQELACETNAPRQGYGSTASRRLEQLMEERQSAQQCLLLWENATSFEQILRDSPPPSPSPPNNQPEEEDSPTETATAITDARDKVAHMLAELQKQLLSLTQRSLANNNSNDTPDQPKQQQQQQQQQLEEDHLRLLKQIDMAKQCLDACDLAAAQASRQRVHVLENVVAEDDSHQVIVFPAEGLLHVKNVRAGKSSTQWLGAISDASLQRLSADRAASLSNSPSPAKESDPAFGNKYGLGYKLQERETVGIQSMTAGNNLQSR